MEVVAVHPQVEDVERAHRGPAVLVRERDRGEAIALHLGAEGFEFVPVGRDRVVVRGPWQAGVGEGRIGGCELRVAVGRQIDRAEGLIVQRVREGQRDGGDRIIPVIADVGSPWHDAGRYLAYHVMV